MLSREAARIHTGAIGMPPTGFHVRCKSSGSRLYGGASQDLRIALALAVNERFGWRPVIKRSAAAVELLVTFHNAGLSPPNVLALHNNDMLLL